MQLITGCFIIKSDDMNENNIIQRVRKDLQVPAYFKGYRLFFETIEIFLTIPETYIVKDVYYTLGKKYNLSISQVENRLHNIVKYLWKIETWRAMEYHRMELARLINTSSCR